MHVSKVLYNYEEDRIRVRIRMDCDRDNLRISTSITGATHVNYNSILKLKNP